MPNLRKISREKRQEMQRAFEQAVQQIRDDAVIKDIEARLEAGDVDGVLRILGISEAAFEPMQEALRQAYRTGGKTGAEQIGKIPTPEGEIAFRFNVRNQRAEEWVRRESSRLIVEVVEDQKEMVRERMQAALAQGRNPRSSALDLVGRIDQQTRKRVGGFIGTTQRQAEWSARARDELENLDSNYFTRELRDKRFDARVRKAIEKGEPLDQKTIDRAITQMQARTQRYRGETIARTESINALRGGQHESLEQAMEEGEVNPDDVTRTWDATLGSRTRGQHASMNGQTRQKGEPFTAPDGSRMMHPGDTSLGATAENIINCRCQERVTIDFAGQQRKIEGFSDG
ncbi:head morphogenesis [Salicola phage CGphi29]|uniref:head morphogenesis n=1 Tax=Salicola phage CGphi29 TaxID=754067 RepID=UPI0002C10B9C|nr:head morphogenesis [Salicola phage CGphi29]AGH31817.1 hypothetical protein SLPG_00023 [Salicola phage CGphi29]